MIIKNSNRNSDKKTIKFDLNIEERNESVAISIRSYDQAAGYPRIEESVFLDYPEELILALNNWRTAYHVYYKHIAGDQNIESLIQGNNVEGEQTNLRLRRGRRARGSNQKEIKFKNLTDLEKELKRAFSQWLKNPKILLIQDFIRKKIGASVLDGSVRSSDILFDKINIFIDCRGEHSIEFRKLPWSEWLILPENINKEHPQLVNFFHADNNLNSDSVLASVQAKKPRFLVLIGECRDLNFKEEIDLFQKIADKQLANVQFLNANDAEFNTEKKFLDELKKLLQDDRGWTSLALICHGEDENEAGEIIISPQRISFTVSRFAESLIVAKQNGLRFAFLGCCRGTLIAQDLIRYGLHQVFFLTEKVSDRLSKQFTKQFVNGLLKYASVESIKQQITGYFFEDEQRYRFPSAYLLPQIFYHPDTATQDFYLSKIPKSKTIWRFTKQLLPQSWKEGSALCTLLFASTVWYAQVPFKDARLLVQSLFRFGALAQNQVDVSIQLITIDQASINIARREDPDFETEPSIDREYLADILNKLSEFDVQVVGINYLLDSNPSTTLENSIQSYLRQSQPLLIFAAQNEPDIEPSTQFANPNVSFTGDASYIPWEISLPERLNCREKCSFAFQMAQLFVLRQQVETKALKAQKSLLLATINSDQPESNDAFKQFIYGQLFEIHQATFNFRSFKMSTLARQDILFNTKIAQFINKVVFPTSLIDYSIPPSRVYEKISTSKLLSSNPIDNEQLKKKLRERLIIIAPGNYREVEESNSDLPLATEYWCWRQSRLSQPNLSACETRLTAGEVHAYMVHHYIEGRNLRQVSFSFTIICSILLSKIICIYLSFQNQEERKKTKQKILIFTSGIGIINILVFFFLGLSIPFLVPASVLYSYTQRKNTKHSHLICKNYEHK